MVFEITITLEENPKKSVIVESLGSSHYSNVTVLVTYVELNIIKERYTIPVYEIEQWLSDNKGIDFDSLDNLTKPILQDFLKARLTPEYSLRERPNRFRKRVKELFDDAS